MSRAPRGGAARTCSRRWAPLPTCPCTPAQQGPSCSTQGLGLGLSQQEGCATTSDFILGEVIPPAHHQAALGPGSQVLGPPPPGARPRSPVPPDAPPYAPLHLKSNLGKAPEHCPPGYFLLPPASGQTWGTGPDYSVEDARSLLAHWPQCAPGTFSPNPTSAESGGPEVQAWERLGPPTAEPGPWPSAPGRPPRHQQRLPLLQHPWGPSGTPTCACPLSCRNPRALPQQLVALEAPPAFSGSRPVLGAQGTPLPMGQEVGPAGDGAGLGGSLAPASLGPTLSAGEATCPRAGGPALRPEETG